MRSCHGKEVTESEFKYKVARGRNRRLLFFFMKREAPSRASAMERIGSRNEKCKAVPNSILQKLQKWHRHTS